MALATDMFVYGLAVPVLPVYALSLGASPATVGALFAVYAGALMLVTPLVGIWVDRSGPRGPLLVGMIGLAAATLLFAFAPGLAGLFLARALQGLSAGVSWTAGLALIATTHSLEQRGKAMGTGSRVRRSACCSGLRSGAFCSTAGVCACRFWWPRRWRPWMGWRACC